MQTRAAGMGMQTRAAGTGMSAGQQERTRTHGIPYLPRPSGPILFKVAFHKYFDRLNRKWSDR